MRVSNRPVTADFSVPPPPPPSASEWESSLLWTAALETKLAKVAELVGDLVRKDNTGQGCAPGGRIGANDTLELQSLLGLNLTHRHAGDEISTGARPPESRLPDPGISERRGELPPSRKPPYPPPPPSGRPEGGDPARPQVPDLPCPKCGSDDVTLSYQRGCGPSCNAGGVEHREHFRRYCPRCSYAWLTTDVLDAEEAK